MWTCGNKGKGEERTEDYEMNMCYESEYMGEPQSGVSEYMREEEENMEEKMKKKIGRKG